MKLFKSTATICIAISIAFFSFLGCKTSKKNNKKDISITILLEDGQTEPYIKKRYADYNPTTVEKSNRTLNEYQVIFNLDKVETTELLKKLEADPKVLLTHIADSSSSSIQFDKSRRSAKAKPKF